MLHRHVSQKAVAVHCCRPVSMTRNENVSVNVTLRQKTNKPHTPTICLLPAKGK